jgi:hypothetical protein
MKLLRAVVVQLDSLLVLLSVIAEGIVYVHKLMSECLVKVVLYSTCNNIKGTHISKRVAKPLQHFRTKCSSCTDSNA